MSGNTECRKGGKLTPPEEGGMASEVGRKLSSFRVTVALFDGGLTVVATEATVLNYESKECVWQSFIRNTKGSYPRWFLKTHVFDRCGTKRVYTVSSSISPGFKNSSNIFPTKLRVMEIRIKDFSAFRVEC